MAYYAVITGSLRTNSVNKAVARYVEKASSRKLKHASIDLPLFNGDLEENGDPEAVQQFKDLLAGAEAIIIITPEYSHSIPGVLKNALDWAGSMSVRNVLESKKILLMGASPMAQGTAFSQAHLRQVLQACGAWVLPQPELFIGAAPKKLSDDGELNDEATLSRIDKALQAFDNWVQE
ncbi:NADPH-dependent FMN reductase [Alkalicoccus urumqiensis]|uniref:NADPH-dependent FMN reductase-like domain-containing protein n=1 Tax=Alkalicoccus urumqiensis TaxID=1548213 RepID=A0A2P6MEU1_ALKUR|nr:NADPH-dependent FMN reductase [Alkalicoccus urumqiensis]PRO64835.1 hypothetical protein C6I21_13070 [Alkalicoccus urumqiensis]